MDSNLMLLNSLLERAIEYWKTSFELLKLKALEKVTGVISSILTDLLFYVIITVFMVFLSMGFSFWLGEILGKIFYGFFIVAAFYGVLALFIHVFMRKLVSRILGNYVVKKILK